VRALEDSIPMAGVDARIMHDKIRSKRDSGDMLSPFITI
jgi:hypothetical protein